MNAVTVEGANFAGTSSRRLTQEPASAERDVESVFVPLTRLSHSKSEQTAMQPPKHITIHLLDRMGVILGQRNMLNTTRVVDLETLRTHGACRVQVPRTIRNKPDSYSFEWTHTYAPQKKHEDLGTSGGAR